MSVTPGIVTFDPAAFVADFPSFAGVSPVALNFNFSLACLQLNNTLCSIVCDEPTRAALLNLLTAHITATLNGVNGQPPSGVVGRISSATQGTVTAQMEWASQVSVSEAYYAQTPWGVTYWQSTAQYRAARYVPPSCGSGYGAGGWNAWPE